MDEEEVIDKEVNKEKQLKDEILKKKLSEDLDSEDSDIDEEELAAILSVSLVAIVYREQSASTPATANSWKKRRRPKIKMEGDESGLFNIEVDSSDESSAEVPRDFQSEENFQAVKREWRGKIETGEV